MAYVCSRGILASTRDSKEFLRAFTSLSPPSCTLEGDSGIKGHLDQRKQKGKNSWRFDSGIADW
ncbi:predicted protein [Histoplasma mississippiense (nom. inval.)]|uniref:predicted protein n=1 Tax=Ajellomyces capsulatus (strain NAm1 / WU24) TaxID=2059318 RepID=UPI000157BCB5|nr:predicted protein [Histoplasma mississippiense (nom. inval.)]EDN06110.1 predicted protein [Histoplasma mississippiense (nom. inval.)]